jgi:TRAP-type C4-dicarboxylate transport system permease large subunit
VPALPPEARTIREDNGTSGLPSLGLLALLSVGAAVAFAKSRPAETATDELIVVSMCVGVGVAFVLSVINKVFKLGLLSRMAERVTFVLIPPLGLIFLVLGTIFLGVATPTEGGAMGAVGALIMALVRKRIDMKLLRQAMDSTMKLSCFVLFILMGSTVFSLTFQGVDGPLWVEHLLTSLPGGQVGFLIVVNILVFVLAFFLDFFELSFIVVPLLGPVAEKLGIDLVWFGVLLAVNMQTSFMHPPFGFALFFLRSVAPNKEYKDRVTGKPTAPVTTGQIYWGSVPFVIIQIIMVGLIIAFPGLVSGGLGPKEKIDLDKVQIQIQPENDYGGDSNQDVNALFGLPPAPAAPPRVRHPDLHPHLQRPLRRPFFMVFQPPPGKRAPRRAPLSRQEQGRSELLGLHEIVEAGLGEAEPQVLVAAEGGHVLVDLLPARVLGAQLAVQGHRFLEGQLHHVLREARQLGARAHQLLERPGLRASYLACMSMWATAAAASTMALYSADRAA